MTQRELRNPILTFQRHLLQAAARGRSPRRWPPRFACHFAFLPWLQAIAGVSDE